MIIDEPVVEKELVYEQVIPPQDSLSFMVKKGQYLRIIDIMGKQVGDLVVLNEHNLKEHMDPKSTRMGITIGFEFTPSPPKHVIGGVYFPNGVGTRITTGNKLLSNINNVMMTIVADTQVPGGTHDLFLDSCNAWIYEQQGYQGREGCHELLLKVLKDYGITQLAEVPRNMNVFMNVPVDPATGLFYIEEPVTRPGDYIEFRAEMDCVCALTACPDNVISKCNGTPPHPPKPLQVQIYNPK